MTSFSNKTPSQLSHSRNSAVTPCLGEAQGSQGAALRWGPRQAAPQAASVSPPDGSVAASSLDSSPLHVPPRSLPSLRQRVLSVIRQPLWLLDNFNYFKVNTEMDVLGK